jgi:hypothetical protein
MKELELLNSPEESRNLGKMTLEARLAVAEEYTHSECFTRSLKMMRSDLRCQLLLYCHVSGIVNHTFLPSSLLVGITRVNQPD